MPNDKKSFLKTFSSIEEAEQYRRAQRLQMSHWERFQLFCKLMRISLMLKSAKVVKKEINK